MCAEIYSDLEKIVLIEEIEMFVLMLPVALKIHNTLMFVGPEELRRGWRDQQTLSSLSSSIFILRILQEGDLIGRGFIHEVWTQRRVGERDE